MKKRTKVLGVWDDNDYGINDGDIKNPIKHQLKKRFLTALDENPSSPFGPTKRWNRTTNNPQIGIEVDY